METISINRDNIKIILSEKDVRRFGIDFSERGTDIASKTVIREVLRLAFFECGFESRGDRLVVRMFQSKDGGCEFFVSRADTDADGHPGEKETVRGFLCITHDCENLYLLCERLRENGFCGQSELFCTADGSFILSAHERNKLPSYIKRTKSSFDFASEYGKTLAFSEAAFDYLCEHAKILCKSGAVERILG